MDQAGSNDVGSAPLGGRARWLARGRGDWPRCASMRRLRVKVAAVVTDWARRLASGSVLLGDRVARRVAEASIARQRELSAQRRPRAAFGKGWLRHLVSVVGPPRMIEQRWPCDGQDRDTASGASRRGAIAGLVERGSGAWDWARRRDRLAIGGDVSVPGLAGGGIGTLPRGYPPGGGQIAHFAHPPTSNALLLLLHAPKNIDRTRRSWQT